MINSSRCREKLRGEIGRWRAYRCRKCSKVFQRFLLRALPVGARICPECLSNPQNQQEYDNACAERAKKESR